jgi:hypothetical protein
MDIYQSRDSRWQVSLTAPKTRYRIGQERVSLDVTSGKDGYLYLLLVGSSNRGYVLFPNEFDQDNALEAGQKRVLPTAGRWKITPGGPEGSDHILALVMPRPLPLEALNLPKAGPYRSLNGKPRTLAKLQRRIARNLVVKEAGGGAQTYGAALLTLQEVP